MSKATTHRRPEDDPPGRSAPESRERSWPLRALLGIGALLVVRVASLGVLPLADSTESRYALVAADMAERGDWLTPRIRIHDHLVPFEGKPPLHFWLAAATTSLLGRGEIAARSPSFLAALATVLAVLVLGARIAGTGAARAAALLLAMGPLFFALAGLVTLDMTLTACTTAAVLIALDHDPRSPRGERRRRGALLGALLGLGFLAKGPIALAVVGGAGIAVSIVRRSLDPWRGRPWGTGGAALLAVAAPWFVISELRHPGFLEYFFVQENWLRYTRDEIGDRFGKTHVYSAGVSLAWWVAAALPALAALLAAAFSMRRRGAPTAPETSPEGEPAVSGPEGGPDPAPVGGGTVSTSEFLAASLALAILLAPSRQVLVTYLLPAAPLAALAAGLAWTRAGLSLGRLGAAALLLALLYGAGILAAEPKVTGERSTRDAVRLARRIAAERGLDEVVFLQKTPWSAYYYGDGAVVPRLDDRYLMRSPETLARHADAVFVLKDRERRKLGPELAARFEWVGRTGEWHLAVAARGIGTGRSRAEDAETDRIKEQPASDAPGPAGGGQ